MNKIRFINPIRKCVNIQGKGYTVTLIASIIAAIVLSITAIICEMPICASISGIAGVGSVVGFGLWFGVELLNVEEEKL